MNSQWMNMEHYRLHCVEQWPDSPHKDATLAGIRTALERLSWGPRGMDVAQHCSICLSRKRPATVLSIVRPAPLAPENSIVAA